MRLLLIAQAMALANSLQVVIGNKIDVEESRRVVRLKK